jgi:alcohol dehydrogenase YqhD (iron-dependent ADH family)
MRKLKQFCATMALTLALTLPAFAGEMSTPGIISSSPREQSSVMGDIGMPGATAVLDPVTEAALSLLGSLLSLF